MKTLCMCTALACSSIVPAAVAHAQSYGSHHASVETKAVNAMCPIGKEPIVPSAGTVLYKGNTIGLCCPGCGKQFLAWDDARKDRFITLAVAGQEPGEPHGKEPTLSPADPDIIAAQLMHYPINTCIVMGAELGSMGDPINIIHNGRLVRLCCEGCIDTLTEDPKKVMADLDAAILKSQIDSYPLETCVVSGAKLGSMGKPINVFHENRLAQLCCAGCMDAFKADPAAAMSKVDAAYANAQRDAYPLDTCIVSDAKLGSMGEPIELVAGTQLIRFCCAGCLPRFRAEPQKYLSKLSQD